MGDAHHRLRRAARRRRRDDRGLFIPYQPPSGGDTPQTRGNQRLNAGKGVHPVGAIVPGLYDLFVFDAHDPANAMRDFAVITGHEGIVANLGLDWVERFGAFTFSIGPRLALGDSDFTSEYFGVTPVEAALNGRVSPFSPVFSTSKS